jgi:hypothetical protein
MCPSGSSSNRTDISSIPSSVYLSRTDDEHKRESRRRESQREREKEGVLEAWQEAALNMKFFSAMEFCFFLFLVNSSRRFPVCIFRTNYIILRNVEIPPPPSQNIRLFKF